MLQSQHWPDANSVPLVWPACEMCPLPFPVVHALALSTAVHRHARNRDTVDFLPAALDPPSMMVLKQIDMRIRFIMWAYMLAVEFRRPKNNLLLNGVASSEFVKLFVNCSNWAVKSNTCSEISPELSRSGMSSRSSNGAISELLLTDINDTILCMSSSLRGKKTIPRDYWQIQIDEMKITISNTYVALPSRKKTQLRVNSRSADVILRDTGLKLSVNDCWVGSTLAYLRIFILADAKTRFFPICDTWKHLMTMTKINTIHRKLVWG